MANENARKLRKRLTDSERYLWKHLRGLAPHFRKQAPIGAYIVDFRCHSARLIIEVDGGQHNHEGAIGYDAKRTQWLESQGYRVLRFWNNDVLENIEGVMSIVAEALTLTPAPTPPHKGEGL